MSGEPNHLTLRDLAYWQSRRTHKSPPGPRPTLGDPAALELMVVAVLRTLSALRADGLRGAGHSLGR
jgi:hypothetical protein